MDRIAEAIKRLRGMTYVQFPSLPAVEQYIDTGDLATLKKIGRVSQGWSFGHELAEALRAPGAWEDRDRRVLHALHASGIVESIWSWLNKLIERERPGEDFHAAVRKELEQAEAKRAFIAEQTLRYLVVLREDGHVTSAGRFLLSLSSAEFQRLVKNASAEQQFGRVAELLMQHAPQHVEAVVDHLLAPRKHFESQARVVRALLEHGKDRYIPDILAAIKLEKNPWPRFQAGLVLYEYDSKRFGQLVLDTARESLDGSAYSNNHNVVGTWMIERYGAKVVPEITKYLASKDRQPEASVQIIDAAAKELGAGAASLHLAAIDSTRDAAKVFDTKKPEWWHGNHFRAELELRLRAIGHLIAIGGGNHDQRIEQELRNGLGEPDPSVVIGFLNQIGKWSPQRLEADVWGLMAHKSKPVREAAARALARMGDAALPKAKELLQAKKADTRAAAVTLLSSSATDAAMAELEARLDEEPADDVRDQILLGLAAAWAKQGRVLTRKDIEKRIKKAQDKLAEPVATWAVPDKLPPLYWKEDGKKLSRDAVAYLIFRQARAKEIQPDVEAAPMYPLIDRERSGEFARAVLQGFLGSKQEAGDRWALAIAGLLGDDRLVPEIVAQIRQWVEVNRGKLAEYAVQALALMGSDVALLSVDAMAIRYRNKMKNVGKAAAESFVEAAQKQGITPEELGDRVVPWLGFEPGKPRIIEAGKSRIEAGIGMDLKLAFKDLEKNKPVKSLPKSAPSEVLEEFKEISANLREVVKAQMLRLENLLVRQRRWPVAKWKELFLQHPLLLPFAVRLVWGHYDDSGTRTAAFRALEDRTLTTHTDESFELSAKGSVGMIHPLELTEEDRTAWRNHLADYEIEPPFPQLEREVVRCKPDQNGVRVWRDVAGTSLNAMTFKGRAERLGWYRGSVVDGGGITSYFKSFPSAGTDVFLGVEDFYIGIDMYSDMKLGEVYFCRHGSVTMGSYTYDEPANGDDPRVVSLGDVPAIVYSEAMGDLQKIAGKKEQGGGDDE